MYEDGDWGVKGSFKTAFQENDPVSWEREGGEYLLFVALVCNCLDSNQMEVLLKIFYLGE